MSGKGAIVSYTRKNGTSQKGVVVHRDQTPSLTASGRALITLVDDNHNPVPDQLTGKPMRVIKNIATLTHIGFQD